MLADDRGQTQHAGGARQAQYADGDATQTAPQGRYDDVPSTSQGQYAGDSLDQQTPHGGEFRGDTATAEHVREGGDPTARGQVQHGGELPDQVSYDAGQPGTAVADPASTTGEPVGRREDTAVSADPAGRHGSTNGTHTADAMVSASETDSEGRAALVAPDRAESYGTRWDAVKGEFVDEPRRAVADADALVGELLDEMQELFRAQRSDIERGLDNDEASTEDLRVALRRYRSFFDRLLSI